MASEWLPHPLGDHGVLLGHMHITKDALQRMIVEHCRAATVAVTHAHDLDRLFRAQ